MLMHRRQFRALFRKTCDRQGEHHFELPPLRLATPLGAQRSMTLTAHGSESTEVRSKLSSDDDFSPAARE